MTIAKGLGLADHDDCRNVEQAEVPTSITLKVLHDVIQAVMGWFDYHLWEFTIDKQRYGLPMDEDWGMAPRKEAAKVRLLDVLKPRRTTIDYLYDFGDGWEHRLTVTRARPGDPEASYPRYVGGERNAPPEDCGGTPGFYDMLDALAFKEGKMNGSWNVMWRPDRQVRSKRDFRALFAVCALPVA